MSCQPTRIQLQVVDASGKGDVEAAFAQTRRLPLAVVDGSRVLPASGLIAYGPTRGESRGLAARCVDQTLNGAEPSDLPVEQPTRVHLGSHLKSAKALGLTLPQTLLQRVDG